MGRYKEDDVIANRKEFYVRTFSAGRYRKVVRYTRPLPGDSPTVRASKAMKTSAAARYINIANCTERLLWLLCCNYDQKDAAFVTFTYRDDCLPASRSGVQEDVKKLIRKSRPAFKRSALPFPVIYTVEGQPSKVLPQADSAWETVPWKDRKKWDALEEDSDVPLVEDTVRLHAHAFLLLPDEEDRALIRSLWPHGKVHINYIRVNDFTSFVRLAAYVTKESRMGIRPVGERSYIPSLGLIQPQVDGHWCGENEGIAVPTSAEKVLRHGDNHDDVYGSHCEWVTYRFPRPNAAAPKSYQPKGRIPSNRKRGKSK